MTELVQATVTEEQLDATIEHFKTLSRGALLVYAIAIGNYLLNQYFGGSFANLKSHDPRKAQSFNDLVTRRQVELAEIGLSRATLRRYLAAAEVWHDLPADLRNELDLTDLHALAPVKNTNDRRRIAHEAVSNGWLSRQVVTAVAEHKLALRGGKRKPGPKPQLEVLKAAAAVVAAVGRMVKLGPAPDVLYETECRKLEVELWDAADELRMFLQRRVTERERALAAPLRGEDRAYEPTDRFALSREDLERPWAWVVDAADTESEGAAP
jgi:hypothetical protein